MKKRHLWITLLGCAGVFFPICPLAGAQATSPTATPPLPEWIQQAQTVSIPLTAYNRQTLQPVKDIPTAELHLLVEGKPQTFQLAQVSSSAPINLLIVQPFGEFQPRRPAVEQAIQALQKQSSAAWNISILDDSGNQTAYTRDIKTVETQLQSMADAPTQQVSPDDWRATATLAIAAMRDLPGRRVVLSLGDIFHTVFTGNDGELYEAYSFDVAEAARDAGAVVYAAESAGDVDALRRLVPYEKLAGSGPWLLTVRNGDLAGWICDSVAATLEKIQQDSDGFYELQLHLESSQMDGQLRPISVRAQDSAMLLQAPVSYVAPNLKRLRLLDTVPAVLREDLRLPTSDEPGSPLELATQLAYFPHPDGRTGTQIATTAYFWNAPTPPPAEMATALQLEQTRTGFISDTSVTHLRWTAKPPVWMEDLDVEPGAYTLRVAAADAAGKVHTSLETPFTVSSSDCQPVLASSLVLGKSCTFVPPAPESAAGPAKGDYLRAGNCDLQPDATYYFSPEDVLWTLVRVTPTGKLASRPAKDWKASFALLDSNGNRVVEDSAHLLPASDGSFAATTAFALSNPKLKLANGQYVVAFRLKGPGVDRDMDQLVPITIYNVIPAENAPKH